MTGPRAMPPAATRGGGPSAGAALIDFERAGYAVATPGGTTAILAEVTTTIRRGGPTVLIGPNGAGKTTFLKLAMGLIAPTRGRVREPPGCKGPLAKAFVFQKPVLLRRSAAANVVYALKAAGRRSEPRRVREFLEQVGLTDHAERPARRLSGGEQQRLALARALAREPDMLLLDEPTASLDPAATKAVEDIVRAVTAAGIAVVLSTHDLAQARRLAGHVLFLAGGRLVEAAPAAAFFALPATEPARRFLAGEIVI